MEIKTLPFQVNQRIVDLAVADTELRKRHLEEKDEAHAKLWAAVHEEYPELDEDADFTLNCEFAEQGVVMITTREHNPGRDIARVLGRMIKDVN